MRPRAATRLPRRPQRRQPRQFKSFSSAEPIPPCRAAIAARARRRSDRIDFLLQCMSPLLAHSGHHDRSERCPLLGVKRTSRDWSSMSANDPKRKLAVETCRRAKCRRTPFPPGANPAGDVICGRSAGIGIAIPAMAKAAQVYVEIGCSPKIAVAEAFRVAQHRNDFERDAK